MSKKILISVIALVALFGATMPVAAQEPEEEEAEAVVVPDRVQISDPPGDANYYGGDAQYGNVGPAGSDLLKLWFSNDAETISTHFQVDAVPGEMGLFYRVRANPNTALNPSTSGNCLVFLAWVDGGGALAGSSADFTDGCGEESATTEAELSIDEGPEGTGVVTITVPRTASPHFEQDSVLFTPTAEIRHYVTITNPGVIENTKPGSDYTVVGELVAPKKEEPEEGEEGEEPEEEPEEEEEPEQSEPPKKKKGKKGAGCPAFTPAEMGAEAETTVVTEEATEEAPIEVPIEAPPGIYPATGDAYHNVQVDTAGGEKGLFVRYEFPEYEDLDLYLYDAAGERVAQAAGFNPFPFVPGETDGTGNGGHSEMGAEQIDGFPTADCVGYTAELHSFISEGGEYTLKLWLGDPAEKEEE